MKKIFLLIGVFYLFWTLTKAQTSGGAISDTDQK
jgi:hypothetical protein